MVKKLISANVLGGILMVMVFILVTGRYFGMFNETRLQAANAAVLEGVEKAFHPMKVNLIQREYEDFELDERWYREFDETVNGTVTVLVFHNVTEKSTDEMSVSVEDFKRQLFALKKLGFRNIPLAEFRDFLNGDVEVSSRAFIITFDDGITEAYRQADSVLEALDFQAVMFAVAGYSIDEISPYYSTGDELKEMAATGRWDIQSHSHVSHGRAAVDEDGTMKPVLANRLWIADEGRLETIEEYETRVENDLRLAKERLEATLGDEVYAFAVPFNDFGQIDSNYDGATDVILNAAWKNYDLLLYQFRSAIGGEYRSNYADVESGGKHAVTRINVLGGMSLDDLLLRVSASQGRPLPYSENFTNQYRWVSGWGRHKISDGKVTFLSVPGGSYFGYLDGSREWKDYSYELDLRGTSAKAVSLVLRMTDSYHYAQCRFGIDGTVDALLTSEKDGVNDVLLASRSLGYSVGEATVSARVVGRSFECAINGRTVTSASLPLWAPFQGGVGLRFWGEGDLEDSVLIDGIRVKPILK